AEFDVAGSRIRIERTAQLKPGTSRNRAFFDDQLGTPRFLRDLACDIVDRGEVGFPRTLWGRANTNEDGVAGAKCLAGVRRVGNLTTGARGGQNLVEVFLVDRDAASIELRDARFVDVGANYIVSGLRQTRSGDESHVPTAHDGKTQGNPPRIPPDGRMPRGPSVKAQLSPKEGKFRKQSESECH